MINSFEFPTHQSYEKQVHLGNMEVIQLKSWFSQKSKQVSNINQQISQQFQEQKQKTFNYDYVPQSPKHCDVFKEQVNLHQYWNKQARKKNQDSIPPHALKHYTAYHGSAKKHSQDEE